MEKMNRIYLPILYPLQLLDQVEQELHLAYNVM